jgi:ribonuclease P protein component
MFPRAQRLRHRRDIDKIIKSGRRLATSSFMIRTISSVRPAPRVTVVVASTVSKRAVIRNRLKRQTRHQIRQLLQGVNLSVDIMVSLKRESLGRESIDRLAELRQGLSKLNIVSK